MVKEFKLNINGAEQTVKVDANMPLLWVLRDFLDLNGTKYGCGVGVCGACTVLLNNRAIRSCQIPIDIIKENKITTIEGISKSTQHPVQKAWIEANVPQCGYCQCGQIMSVVGMLNEHSIPNDSQIDEVMKYIVCRCGTYKRIKNAIRIAIKNR